MEVKAGNFSSLSGSGQVIIPFFQRPYVWKEAQWKQFFEDLHSSYKLNRAHFLGSVILQDTPSTSGGYSQDTLVIDGQQRLTTFSILIKALYDTLEDEQQQDYKQCLFQKPVQKKMPKIQHSKCDAPHFTRILQANTSTDLGDAPRDNRLLQAYIHFSQTLKDKQLLEHSQEFLDYLTESDLWVVIRLDTYEDAQQIFDSINTAGLRLSATDIIKNALFDRTKSLRDDYETLYTKYWESVFEKDDTQRKFWEQETGKGSLKRIQSEVFLHAFAIIKGFFDVEKDTLEKLSMVYKKHIKGLDKECLEDLLQELHRYALLYKDLPHDHTQEFGFDDFTLKLFNTMRVTKIYSAIPLILYIQALGDTKVIQEGFCWLEMLILTYWLCKESYKNFGFFFGKLTRDLCKQKNQNSEALLQFLKESLLKHKPEKAKIEQYLKSSEGVLLSNDRAALVLFSLELYRRRQHEGNSSKLAYDYSLEHLMPVKWEAHWSNVVGTEGNDLEKKSRAERLIYQIGNMVLLEKTLNTAIGNHGWHTKLYGDGSKKKNLSNYDRLSTTKEILNVSQWDASNIEVRTQRLSQEFLEMIDQLSLK
ncbi:DUF262 domain-containing protein [Helicobacter cynogastricus]|uniref:DUF262 domain-containing protein n=1 Tax=Helicobacter cynogastricus TaxID=329937 RepID=UPI000CF17A2C|nr:DUF262 domain-containing protein [Helicobacter cynogastricus]